MDVLSAAQIETALTDLNDWTYTDGALTKTFRLADFARAVDFVEQLADVAESMQHHPDIDIRYNKVTLHLATHSAGGITVRDLELAVALDQLA